MNRNLFWAGVLFAVQVVNYFFLRPRGFYWRYHYYDKFLHVLAGIMFGLIWLFISRRSIMSAVPRYIAIIAFAVLGSFLWECWELWGYLLHPNLTIYYSPDLGDSLADIAAGLFGAVILCLVDFVRHKPRLSS